MKNIKTFKSFNENLNENFFDKIFGDKGDNESVREIISRLEKVDPYNNPYKIENEEERGWGSPKFKIKFEDVTISITQDNNSKGGGFNNYNLKFSNDKKGILNKHVMARSGVKKKLYNLIKKLYDVPREMKNFVKKDLNNGSSKDNHSSNRGAPQEGVIDSDRDQDMSGEGVRGARRYGYRPGGAGAW